MEQWKGPVKEMWSRGGNSLHHIFSQENKTQGKWSKVNPFQPQRNIRTCSELCSPYTELNCSFLGRPISSAWKSTPKEAAVLSPASMPSLFRWNKAMENRMTSPANMILQHKPHHSSFCTYYNKSIFVVLNGENKQRNPFHKTCPSPSPTQTLLKHKVWSLWLENSLSCQYPHWSLGRAKHLNQCPLSALTPNFLLLPSS